MQKRKCQLVLWRREFVLMSENAEGKGVGVGRYIGRGGGDVVSDHRAVKQEYEIPSRENEQ